MSSDSYICSDVISLILRLFTVQTLLQLRCVCKSWKQLIDSTSFVVDHLSLQTPRILVQKQNLEYILMDADNGGFYDTLRGPNGVLRNNISSQLRAFSTVHGVICLYDNNQNLILWNPSIRRHLTIPIPAICHEFHRLHQYCGFWIDPSNKEFKVVIFCFKRKGIALYSSKRKIWAEFAMYPHGHAGYRPSPQVLIDRVAYWTAASVIDREYVVYYDFGKDESGKIDLPRVFYKPWSLCAYVSKWRGCLSVVYSAKDFDYPFGGGVLWVMQEGSWGKMASFRLIEDVRRVLCVLELGDCKVRVLASTSKGELVLYDRGDTGCIPLLSRENECFPVRSCVFSFAYDFVESLLIPDQTW